MTIKKLKETIYLVKEAIVEANDSGDFVRVIKLKEKCRQLRAKRNNFLKNKLLN